MAGFRFKQIALVLFLMASLLSAGSAVCACSHHEEVKAVEGDCHSQHKSTETIRPTETAHAIDESCVCVVDRREPFVASKSPNKELKTFEPATEPVEIVSVPDFVAVNIRGTSTTKVVSDSFYSNALRPLGPARAPPRL